MTTTTAVDMNGETVRVGDRVMVECEVVAIQRSSIVVSHIDLETDLPMLVNVWHVSHEHVLKSAND